VKRLGFLLLVILPFSTFYLGLLLLYIGGETF
jgi:hypothetical protein